MSKENKNNMEDLYEAKLHEFDIDDLDKAYEDYSENWKSPEELMKQFPPEETDDIKEWKMEDFRNYYKGIKRQFGKDAAWNFLYAKILERAGESDGGVEVTDGEFPFV